MCWDRKQSTTLNSVNTKATIERINPRFRTAALPLSSVSSLLLSANFHVSEVTGENSRSLRIIYKKKVLV